MPTNYNPGDGHICAGYSHAVAKEVAGEKVTATEGERSQGPPYSTNIEIDNDNGCAQHGGGQQQQHRSSLVETTNVQKQNEDHTTSSFIRPRRGRRSRNQESHFPPRSQSAPDLTPKWQVPEIPCQDRSDSSQRGAMRVTPFAPKLRCEASDECRKVTRNGGVASRVRSTAIGVRRGSW